MAGIALFLIMLHLLFLINKVLLSDYDCYIGSFATRQLNYGVRMTIALLALPPFRMADLINCLTFCMLCVVYNSHYVRQGRENHEKQRHIL